ncbi:MAG: hypothetical protein ACFFCQ_14285 [Promethearchaeota archaeon]
MPILSIICPSNKGENLFKFLIENNVKVTNIYKDSKSVLKLLILDEEELMLSIEPDNGNCKIKVFENDFDFHPKLLGLFLDFIKENKVFVIANRISKLLPKNFPPIEDI